TRSCGSRANDNRSTDPAHPLADRVVPHRVEERMQAASPGRADVHAGTLAHRLKALKDGDRTGIVGQKQAPPEWMRDRARRPRPPSASGAHLLFYLGLPRDSAVVITWPASVANPPLAPLARGNRTPDPDPGDGAATELGVEPPDELWAQQPHLCRPGGGVGDDEQLPVGEAAGPGVGGQRGAHDLLPPAEHRAHSGRGPPAPVVEQPVDGDLERLRVLPPGAAAPAGGGRAGTTGPSLGSAMAARDALA